MDIKDQIKTFFKGDVLDDEKTLTAFSHDASLFEIKPQVVVFPKDTQDIKNLISFVSERPEKKLSITARSGGTDMTGGSINDSIILDLNKYFNQIIHIGSDQATVQPGVFYKDFEKETLKQDLLLPSYPASREICTVGGMVANNSGGEKTLIYGKTERYIKKLKVVLSDGNEYTFAPLSRSELEKKLKQKNFEGEIYRKIYRLVDENYDLLQKAKPQVSKNSAGYFLWNVWDKNTFDMTKLIVGSQGTLGIVTEIEFGLIEPSTHSKLLVIFLNDLQELAKIVDRVLTHNPESFESYDDYTLKFAIRFLPDVIKVMKPKNLLSLAWQFIPEVWMTLTGGIPKLILLAEFTGSSEAEVREKAQAAQKDLEEFQLPTRITKSREETKKYWVIRRESFNLLRHHLSGMRTAPFIDDLIVQPNALPAFLPKLREILSHYNLIFTIAGHVGDGNFHIIPLMKLSDPKERAIILELGKKVYDLVFEFKGSMTAEHNDGLVRGPYLKQMYGEKVFNLFKEVKDIFDPKGIFNPHKKVDATFEYLEEHIVKTS